MKRRLMLGMSLLAAGLGLLAGCSNAPESSFTTVKGERIELSALRGRPVLVTFWASNCASCLDEMPRLTELYRDYHARGLEVIAVAMQYDMPSQVVALATQRDLPYPVVLDPQGQHAHAFEDVTVVPSVFLLSPEGDIRFRKIGPPDMKALRSMINSMLAET
ncbi:TlpA disulfide reductase family protein [Methylococcus sp. EFPC2]|uniref:TlpA disulfide reductase family protein n=1 Tax=Methylococcus sp. EFPC2 TaxID=2812648 RepID=UPI0019670744|nr:TlpA disulfide reductase family protein [Methylococcus sp. EFPC2]QSA97973.1 TlpA family protein disulfide reductase [Methylococcus sp. EFPC2]